MPIPNANLPGHRRLHDRVIYALERCQELQSVEFKESQPWNVLKWKIAKTAMAMANLRDGGIIVIGVSERDDSIEMTGISADDLKTYDVDDIVDFVDSCGSPSVRMDIVQVPHDEKQFLAIHSHEFHDTPIVCKKQRDRQLERAAVYIRPSGKPQTAKVENALQMHDLLELAAEKRARRILEVSTRVGLSSSGTDPFEAELHGL